MVTLIPLAFAAAAFGAVSGLGGGVFILPLLVTTMGPEWEPGSLAALSLGFVFLNSLSSLFLGRQIRNVDFPFARLMAVGSAVGVMVGVSLHSFVSRDAFELYLGVFLFLLSLFIFWRSSRADAKDKRPPEPGRPADAGFSFLIGSFASFFGLGGGILQVPYMVYMRRRPVHQATATSQVILASTAFVSLVLYLLVRRVPIPWMTFVTVAPFVVAGGIAGSALSRRLRGPWIVRLLGATLLLIGLRLVSRSL